MTLDVLPLPFEILALGALTVGLAGLVQASLGFGFSMLAVPMLALIDPALSPVPPLLLTMVLNTAVARREWDQIDWAGIMWIVIGRLPGAILGLFLLKMVSQGTLDALIGGSVLFAVAALSFRRLKVRRTRPAEIIAGTASGVMSMVASISGPPLALLYRDAKGPTLRASLAMVFILGNILTISTRVVADEMVLSDLSIALYMVPGLLLGFWGSRFFVGRVEGPPLRAAVLLFATVCATVLLIR